MLRERPVDRTTFFLPKLLLIKEIIQSEPSNFHVNPVMFKHNIKSSLKSSAFFPPSLSLLRTWKTNIFNVQRIYHFIHFHLWYTSYVKEMATHSSVLAWRIPGTGEPGGLSSMGSHRVRHD